MKWLTKLNHRFWVWIDKQIVIHRLITKLDQAKDDMVTELSDQAFGTPLEEGTITKGYDKP